MGLGFRVTGSGFRVQGLGVLVWEYLGFTGFRAWLGLGVITEYIKIDLWWV